MTKTKSGLILIAIGVGLNIIGTFASRFHLPVPSLLILAIFRSVLMLASVVVILFGFFRLIVGLVSRKKRVEVSGSAVADDSV